MIDAPNTLNLNCKVTVMKEAPGPSVSEEIADIFRNYNIYIYIYIYETLYISIYTRRGSRRGWHVPMLSHMDTLL